MIFGWNQTIDKLPENNQSKKLLVVYVGKSNKPKMWFARYVNDRFYFIGEGNYNTAKQNRVKYWIEIDFPKYNTINFLGDTD